MTTEEYIEEIYHEVHYSGVFLEFSEQINNKLKSPSKTLYDVVFETYEDFKNKGLITHLISN